MDEFKERCRKVFEKDALALGFDVELWSSCAHEVWSEYKDVETGHRWAGFLSACNLTRFERL